MDVADEAVPLHELLVRLGAKGGGIGGLPAPDQPIAPVDRDVVLVAEGRRGDIALELPVRTGLGLGELDRPARITVLSGAAWRASSSTPCARGLP